MTRVLGLYILKLFPSVAQYHYCGGDLLAKFVELFIAFFDLLIKSLVLDLKLFEIN